MTSAGREWSVSYDTQIKIIPTTRDYFYYYLTDLAFASSGLSWFKELEPTIFTLLSTIHASIISNVDHIFYYNSEEYYIDFQD